MHDDKAIFESAGMTPVEHDALRAQAERLRARHVAGGLRWLARTGRAGAKRAFEGAAVVKANVARWHERELTRRDLLRHNDHMLADMGFSLSLLEAGVRAWPWKVDEGGAMERAANRRFRTAVRQLQAYSDAELADLGISRAGIEQAVRHGRPGIDVPVLNSVCAGS